MFNHRGFCCHTISIQYFAKQSGLYRCGKHFPNSIAMQVTFYTLAVLKKNGVQRLLWMPPMSATHRLSSHTSW
jgi:hypothetical protein